MTAGRLKVVLEDLMSYVSGCLVFHDGAYE